MLPKITFSEDSTSADLADLLHGEWVIAFDSRDSELAIGIVAGAETGPAGLYLARLDEDIIIPWKDISRLEVI